MKASSFTLLTLLISGCSTIDLSNGGKNVKLIHAEQANSCKLLTKSYLHNSKGVGLEECKDNAHKKIKNIVVDLGGNAYMVTFEKSKLCAAGGTGVSYNVYNCLDSEE